MSFLNRDLLRENADEQKNVYKFRKKQAPFCEDMKKRRSGIVKIHHASSLLSMKKKKSAL